jgi:hypothetical protein
MARKREDPASLGDLEDLAEAIKSGFHDAIKGKVIPAPSDKGDKGNGDGKSDDDGKTDGDGDGDGDHKPPWSLSKGWFGEH